MTRKGEAQVQDGEGEKKVLRKSLIYGKNFVFKKVPQEDRASIDFFSPKLLAFFMVLVCCPFHNS